MENIRRILSFVRRAVDDYNMISEGDRIAVGVSGGKDSLALLAALSDLRGFYPVSYECTGSRNVRLEFNRKLLCINNLYAIKKDLTFSQADSVFICTHSMLYLLL